MVGPTGGDVRRTATVTVLFCDLVGSTERQTRTGDDAADGFRRAFFAALTDAATATHGEVVKNTGDGLMVVFRDSAVDAVTCASRMHDSVELLDPDDRAFVRIGVSAGEVALDEGDWFGTPVVEAARLCAVAEPGQTLVNDVVRALVGSRGGHQFRSVGALTLKGLPERLAAAAVVRTPIAAPPKRARPMRPRRWPIALTAAVVVGALVAALVIATNNNGTSSVVPPVRGYTPRFEPVRCPADFLSGVPDGRCGDLVVPEDRTKPKGRWIRLGVLRAPARTANGTDDPTISIGTHGRYGTFEDLVKSPARDHSDLISFATWVADTPDRSMACPEFEPVARELLGKPHNDPVTITAGKKALGRCYGRLSRHVDLSRYTYEDAAADVLDLMRALGLAHVNISTWGDYALSAYAIVRAAPAAVRTLTLEGPDAPGTSRVTDPTGELVAAINQYYRLCAKDRACAREYPDLAARLAAVVRDDNASPQVVTFDPGKPDAPLRVYIDGAGSLKAVAFGLERIEVTGVLPSGLARPSAFNRLGGGALGGAVAHWPYPTYLRDWPWARLLSAWCSYDVYTRSETADVSSATNPTYAGIDDGALQWQCAAWPVNKVSHRLFDSFATEVPTLIVEGALNPRVLPEWAATLQSGMPHATVVTFSSRNDDIHDGAPVCLNDLRRRFLADPVKPLNPAGCDSQPITFTPPINSK